MQRNKRMFVLFALGLALSSLYGCGFITKLKARDRLNKGVQEYTAKHYDRAVNFFQESIKYDPTLLNAYLYLATAYSAMYQPGLPSEKNLQNAHKAIETFQEVLQRADNKDTIAKTTAIVNIAGLYDSLEEPDKAKEWSRKLNDIDPNNAEAYYRIGVIDWKLSFKRTGNTGEGVKNLSAQEKEQTVKLIDEGISALNAALEKKPDYGEALEYLNLLYREKAKFTNDDKEKRELIHKADQYAAEALKLKKKTKEEEIKKGKKRI